MEIRFTASIQKALDVVLRLQHHGLKDIRVKYGDYRETVCLPPPDWDVSSFPFSRIEATFIRGTGRKPNGRMGLTRSVRFYFQGCDLCVAEVWLVAERPKGAQEWSEPDKWAVGRLEYAKKFFYSTSGHGVGEGLETVWFDIEEEATR